MTRLFESSTTCYVMGHHGSGWMTCVLRRHHDGSHRDRNGTFFRVNRFSNRAEVVAPVQEG